MVRSKHQPEGLRTVILSIPCYVFLQVRDTFLPLCHVVHQMVEFPGVGCIENGGELRFLRFSEEIGIGILLPEVRDNAFPYFHGHLPGRVTAETVHPAVKPEFHTVFLGIPHGLILIIQAAGICPVVLINGVSKRITLIEVSRLFSHPDMVRRGLVSDPVENHLETGSMGGGEKIVEILLRPEFRINLLIVRYCVIGAEGSFPLLDADLIHGHKPEDVNSEFSKPRELGLNTLEGPFGGKLTDIDFVHHSVVGPPRMD